MLWWFYRKKILRVITLTVGYHIIAEFKNCNLETLKTVGKVKPILENAVKKSGLKKIHSKYHQFKPFGVTGFVLLTESHVSVHTWPEKEYAAVDIFSCGSAKKAKIAFSLLKQGFQPKKIKKIEVKRE